MDFLNLKKWISGWIIETSQKTQGKMERIETFDENTKKADLFLEVLDLQKRVKNVREAMESAETEEELAEMGEEMEMLEERLDFSSWQFGQLVGYDFLAEMRKYWGVQSSKHNVLQERYYKLQKARYEECKRGKKFFTPEDRSFIEKNKLMNELHMEARWKAMEYREIISDIIDIAFPSAPLDCGWDEHWEESPAVIAE